MREMRQHRGAGMNAESVYTCVESCRLSEVNVLYMETSGADSMPPYFGRADETLLLFGY